MPSTALRVQTPPSPIGSRKLTTSSKKKSKTPVRRPKNAEESFHRLKTQLSRYARANDRKFVKRALIECRYLQCIALEATPTAPTTQQEWKALEKELSQTPLDINGILFAESTHVVKILKDLCQALSEGLKLSPESLYQSLIVRLARTTSSADSYFQLNALLGSQDLVLQSPKQQTTALPPSELTLYQANGQIHATIQISHPYGLFRKSDVTSGKPWIPLYATVHERVNLSTGESCRHLSVRLMDNS